MTYEELLRLIQETVTGEIKNQLTKITEDQLNQQWVSIKEACKKLNVSRQTLNNWTKRKDTERLMKLNTKKIGGKVMLNPVGLLEIFKRNNIDFTKYQRPLKEQDDIDREYVRVTSKTLSGKELSGKELGFYKKECAKRGDPDWLPDRF